jgi:hypothetical protein
LNTGTATSAQHVPHVCRPLKDCVGAEKSSVARPGITAESLRSARRVRKLGRGDLQGNPVTAAGVLTGGPGRTDRVIRSRPSLYGCLAWGIRTRGESVDPEYVGYRQISWRFEWA